MCRNVLFPHPLEPMMVMNSPSRAANCSTSMTCSYTPFLV